MGFYIRKSISLGPFRFNLSNSGVGLSVGVRGFRLGTGPRGNYVHMGRHGIYYRQTFPAGRPRRHEADSYEPRRPLGHGTHAPLAPITSGDISAMTDATSAQVVNEINTRSRRWRLLPIGILLCLATVGYGIRERWPERLWYATGGGAFVLLALARRRDLLARTTVIFYNLESEAERAFSTLHAAADDIAASGGLWNIDASGDVLHRKYHAGASVLLRRDHIRVGKTPLPGVRTNIDPIVLPAGKETLYFFPDRVFVRVGRRVAAISYGELDARASATRFIESERLPRDAEVIDRTWRYVNKDGGPDRRFRDNHEIPVCRYGEIVLRSGTGLNELFQVSRADAALGFADALSGLGRATAG